MFLTIGVYDSYIYNIREELNDPDDLFHSKYNYCIQKSSKTFYFSLKLSTELSYTQIVKIIQLFSDIINITSSVDNFREK
jgi:hypothetical protein